MGVSMLMRLIIVVSVVVCGFCFLISVEIIDLLIV